MRYKVIITKFNGKKLLDSTHSDFSKARARKKVLTASGKSVGREICIEECTDEDPINYKLKRKHRGD